MPRVLRPTPSDLDILWQVYVWMTWPQYETRSFDQLVHWAEVARWSMTGRPPLHADRTALPNRLKRLHAAVAAAPAKFGFPEWVSRLPIEGRRVNKPKPKQSGAQGRRMRRVVDDLHAEAERAREELKTSQTRPPNDC
jgi:hypothetical protein